MPTAQCGSATAGKARAPPTVTTGGLRRWAICCGVAHGTSGRDDDRPVGLAISPSGDRLQVINANQVGSVARIKIHANNFTLDTTISLG